MANRIEQLHTKLTEAGIPHQVIAQVIPGGQMIVYPDWKNRYGDVAENEYTYGLEAFGFDIPHKDVRGYLTVEKAFEFFERAHSRKADRE